MRHVRRRPVPEWVVLRIFSYQHEAEVVKSVLEGSGIEAMTIGDDCGALDPALSLVRGVRLLVAADQLERAEEILLSHPGDDPPGEPPSE
jgi:hypothetical protein